MSDSPFDTDCPALQELLQRASQYPDLALSPELVQKVQNRKYQLRTSLGDGLVHRVVLLRVVVLREQLAESQQQTLSQQEAQLTQQNSAAEVLEASYLMAQHQLESLQDHNRSLEQQLQTAMSEAAAAKADPASSSRDDAFISAIQALHVSITEMQAAMEHGFHKLLDRLDHLVVLSSQPTVTVPVHPEFASPPISTLGENTVEIHSEEQAPLTSPEIGHVENTGRPAPFLSHNPQSCFELQYAILNPHNHELRENPNLPRTSNDELLDVFPDCLHNYTRLKEKFPRFEKDAPNSRNLEQELTQLQYRPHATIHNLRLVQNWFVTRFIPYHIWGISQLPASIFSPTCVSELNRLRGVYPHMSWGLCCRYILSFHNIDEEIDANFAQVTEAVPAPGEDLHSFLVEWYAQAATLTHHFTPATLNRQLKRILSYYPFLTLPQNVTSDFQQHYNAVIGFTNLPALDTPRRSTSKAMPPAASPTVDTATATGSQVNVVHNRRAQAPQRKKAFDPKSPHVSNGPGQFRQSYNVRRKDYAYLRQPDTDRQIRFTINAHGYATITPSRNRTSNSHPSRNLQRVNLCVTDPDTSTTFDLPVVIFQVNEQAFVFHVQPGKFNTPSFYDVSDSSSDDYYSNDESANLG